MPLFLRLFSHLFLRPFLPLFLPLWWSALLGCQAATAAPVVIEDTLAQRLAACTVCHGKEGRAAPDGYRPRLAGKPAGYLLNQLRNFRDGRRHYGAMVALVDPLTDDYMRDIAQHFAALDLPYAAPRLAPADSATLQRGRQLALQGDAATGLPACAACHGAALNGVLPSTPGLLGLPRDYLLGQLGAWVNGQRRALAPDCMAQVALKLSRDDITAVSTWLARQTVPDGAKPQTPSLAALPLRCGSVPPVQR